MLWPRLDEAPATAALPASQPVSGVQEDRTGEVNRRIADARQTGYREGEAAGRRQVEAEVARLAEAAQPLASLRSKILREAEADLVRLSIAIARRILHRELAVDPGAIGGLVMAALDRLQGQTSFRVSTHPDLAPALRDCLDRRGVSGKIEVIADAAQPRGSVIFETARGALDASVETQLQEIERGLTDRLGRRTG